MTWAGAWARARRSRRCRWCGRAFLVVAAYREHSQLQCHRRAQLGDEGAMRGGVMSAYYVIELLPPGATVLPSGHVAMPRGTPPATVLPRFWRRRDAALRAAQAAERQGCQARVLEFRP